jgi:trigger factor
MEVTLLAENGLKKEYSLIVSKADVASAIDLQIAKISKDVKIEGFRPGKVPASIIKQRYLSNILQNALEQLVDKSSKELLKNNNLKPATLPKIELVQFQEQGVLEYKMFIEVLPEVVLPDFESITLNRTICQSDPSDVDEYLKNLTNNKKQFVSVAKEAAELGDAVLIDYQGSIDEVMFAGGTASKYKLELGSKTFIDNFEEQLVGSKVGDEKVVSVRFPEKYHSEDLAGKEAKFLVKIHDIMQGVAPELSDELAKEYGAEDLNALMGYAKEVVDKLAQDAAKKKLIKDLFDQLELMCTFSAPQTMVEKEFEHLWKKALEHNEQDQEIYQRLAKRRVMLGLLLAQVAQNDEVVVDSASINQAVFREARKFPGQENQVLDYYRNNEQAFAQLKNQVVEEKAVDYILTKVKYIDHVLPSAEFYKAVKIDGEDFS